AAAGRHGAGGESRSADWVSGRGPDVHDRRGALGAEGKREVTARPGSPGVALDPADPAFRADPYAVYRELREHAPVTRLSAGQAWLVTGYEEVRTLLRDPRVGTATPREPRATAPSARRFLRARQDAGRLF